MITQVDCLVNLTLFERHETLHPLKPGPNHTAHVHRENKDVKPARAFSVPPSAWKKTAHCGFRQMLAGSHAVASYCVLTIGRGISAKRCKPLDPW